MHGLYIIVLRTIKYQASIKKIKKRLAIPLMSCTNNDSLPIIPKRILHEIKKKKGNFNSVKRRCNICYQNNVKMFGLQSARNSTIKVATFCVRCVSINHIYVCHVSKKFTVIYSFVTVSKFVT